MITNIVTSDEKKKIVKNIWSGKVDPGKVDEATAAIKKGCEEADNTLRKFNKGEPVFLADVANLDMRFLSPDAQKFVQESSVFCLSHCKKFAQVVTSLILEKSMENAGMTGSNNRMFDSEQEAMKWLME